MTVGDGALNTHDFEVVTSLGHIPTSGSYGLAEFPGLALLASTLKIVIGFSLQETVVSFLMVRIVIVSLAVYLLSRNAIENEAMATLASIVVLEGSWLISWSNILWPSALGLVYILLALVVWTRKELKSKSKLEYLFLIIAVVAIITHFVSSLLILLILASTTIFSRWRKDSKEANWHFKISIVLTIVFALWFAYDYGVIQLVVGSIPTNLELSDAIRFLTSTSNANTATAPWSDAVRYFWIILAYLAGAMIAIIKLTIRAKTASRLELRLAIGLATVIATTIALTLVSGGNQFYRFLYYGSLFASPLFVLWISNKKGRIAYVMTLLLLISIFVLAFPAFLSYNSNITVTSYQPHELAVGNFLSKGFAASQPPNIFGDPDTNALVSIFLPYSNFTTIKSGFGATYFSVPTGAVVIDSLSVLYAAFKSTHGNNALVLSDRLVIDYSRYLNASQRVELVSNILLYANTSDIIFAASGISVAVNP